MNTQSDPILLVTDSTVGSSQQGTAATEGPDMKATVITRFLAATGTISALVAVVGAGTKWM
jgi:hypothetical protein